MKKFKIAAYGDSMYIQAKTEEEAVAKLFEVTGQIPRSLLTITSITSLPKGEEWL